MQTRRIGSLLISALLAAGSLACGERNEPVRDLEPERLLALLAEDEAVLLLDVRTPEEFRAGHIPAARNLPVQEIGARIAGLEPWRDRDVIAYCRSGRRSGEALAVLEQAGFRRLWHLEGDFGAWASAGRPVETGAPAAGD
jgi:rhodanese-related sulfurtransferase